MVVEVGGHVGANDFSPAVVDASHRGRRHRDEVRIKPPEEKPLRVDNTQPTPAPYEITAHEPPRKASFRGTAGPVRPVGTVTVDPVGDSRSRMTLEFDLEGHGIGKLLAIVARRQAAKEIPERHKKFKELLESGAAEVASD
jgi:hypothetical protein